MAKKHIIYASIAILAIAGVLIFIFQNPLKVALAEYKLVPEDTKFTELYFNNPTTLPTHIATGTPITFSFTIHNLEGATTTYPYQVYFETADGAHKKLAGGKVTLANNASTTVPVSDRVASSNVGKVVVELTSLDQHIDFLLPNNN